MRKPTATRNVWNLSAVALSLTASLFLSAFALRASAQATYSVSNTWFVSTNNGNIIMDNGNRGMAWYQYSGIGSNLVFVARITPSIGLFDANSSGASVGLMNMTGLSGGAQALNQIGAADDGVVYGANLQTSLSAANVYKLYRWATPYSAPTVAYSGDPTLGMTGLDGKRLGDTMAVTGAGSNTMILAGIGGANLFVLFSTTDGTNFTPTVVNVPSGLSGITGNLNAMAFYTNNTFLVKPGSISTVFLVQFPTNFASTTNVTGTVLGSTALVSGNSMMSYSAAGNWVATIQTTGGAGTKSTISLFDVSNIPGGATLLASTNFATSGVNGNGTGGIALGGAGKTNNIYALDSNNGVQAAQIITIPPQPPAFSVSPIGGTVYPPYTMTATLTGTKPLFYRWQSSSSGTAGTFSDIGGANTNSYTVASPSTNYYQLIVSNSVTSVTSSVVLVTALTAVTNPVVTQLFRVTNGAAGYAYLANDDTARGLAYDTNSGRLIVASRTGGIGLYILDANNGTNIGVLNTNGMYQQGTFGLDQVGIADDGAVYACNLAVNGSQAFAINRWGSPTTNATVSVAFTGDPGFGSNDRWGDYMVVRGAGPNTQILVASKSTNVALLTTLDGTNFSSTLLALTGVPPNFAANGIAFGAGNTFWAKSYNPGAPGDLYEIAFDPVALTNAVLFDYSGSGQVPPTMIGLGIDPVNNILAGVITADTPDDLQLFQLTGSTVPPVLFHQAFFASNNANGNENAAVVMKYPHVYALDVNNGIVGLTYGVPASTPPSITSLPVGGTIYTADPTFALTPGVSGTLPLFYQWQFNSVSNLATATNIPGTNATGRSYTLHFPPVTASGWYDVIVTNFGGAVTSTPVQLNVIAPVSNTVVTQLWTLTPGSRSYLDSSTYNTRGLAYDPNTGTLLVCDHANIYVLNATNGADLFSMNTAGLPAGTYTLDQVGVGDDGVLYGCNLALTGNGDVFNITAWSSVSQSPSSEYAAYSGDPGNGSGERWGDTMAVRGAGANTQILVASQNGTNVALLTTLDGQNFTSTLIGVSNVPAGFAGAGIAFGAGNTFWAKNSGYNLRQIAFDTSVNPAASSVLEVFTAGTQVNSSMVGIGVDAANNILAGVVMTDVPHDLQMLLLSTNANPPILFDQAFFATANPNSQNNAAVAIKYPWAFGLDVNNGIVALNYGVPSILSPYNITAVSKGGSGFTLTWASVVGHTYQVQYTTSLQSFGTVWSNVGGPMTAVGASTSYTDTTASGAVRYYRVVGQ